MNIIRFLKNWTLPTAMVTGTIVYLIFAYVPFLEEAAYFFDPILDYIFPWFMFLILFVTFCKIDFRKMRPKRWHMWISLFQIVVSFLFVWIGSLVSLSRRQDDHISFWRVLFGFDGDTTS